MAPAPNLTCPVQRCAELSIRCAGSVDAKLDLCWLEPPAPNPILKELVLAFEIFEVLKKR